MQVKHRHKTIFFNQNQFDLKAFHVGHELLMFWDDLLYTAWRQKSRQEEAHVNIGMTWPNGAAVRDEWRRVAVHRLEVSLGRRRLRHGRLGTLSLAVCVCAL